VTQGIPFTKQSDAQALQAQVDASLGYPKAGVNVGGGVHAPPEQSVTLTYAVPQLLDDGTWGYPIDAVSSTAIPLVDAQLEETLPETEAKAVDGPQAAPGTAPEPVTPGTTSTSPSD